MNYAVIMAGGSGQRLWPLSREHRPKQIIDIFSEQSLLRLCVNRVKSIFDAEHIMVVTNAEYADVVREHLPDIPAENILGEPMGRNTANAIGLAATVLNRKGTDAVMAVFSADQIIEPVEPLAEAVRASLTFIQDHPTALFTFGIKARYAHTGLGYLKRGANAGQNDIYTVEAFKEKPNKSTAHKYIRSGKYCWNSGMFVWRADTILQKLDDYLPHNAERLRRIGAAWNSDKWDDVLQEEFGQLDSISIDFAVMERAREVYMCELDCQWEDVGSYQTLADSIGKVDPEDNVSAPATKCVWLDSQNNIAISESPDHLIAAIHVEDLIIVHTPDATLICRREETDRLRDLLTELKEKDYEQFL